MAKTRTRRRRIGIKRPCPKGESWVRRPDQKGGGHCRSVGPSAENVALVGGGLLLSGAIGAAAVAALGAERQGRPTGPKPNNKPKNQSPKVMPNESPPPSGPGGPEVKAKPRRQGNPTGPTSPGFESEAGTFEDIEVEFTAESTSEPKPPPKSRAQRRAEAEARKTVVVAPGFDNPEVFEAQPPLLTRVGRGTQRVLGQIFGGKKKKPPRQKSEPEKLLEAETGLTIESIEQTAQALDVPVQDVISDARRRKIVKERREQATRLAEESVSTLDVTNPRQQRDQELQEEIERQLNLIEENEGVAETKKDILTLQRNSKGQAKLVNTLADKNAVAQMSDAEQKTLIRDLEDTFEDQAGVETDKGLAKIVGGYNKSVGGYSTQKWQAPSKQRERRDKLAQVRLVAGKRIREFRGEITQKISEARKDLSDTLLRLSVQLKNAGASDGELGLTRQEIQIIQNQVNAEGINGEVLSRKAVSSVKPNASIPSQELGFEEADRLIQEATALVNKLKKRNQRLSDRKSAAKKKGQNFDSAPVPAQQGFVHVDILPHDLTRLYDALSEFHRIYDSARVLYARGDAAGINALPMLIEKRIDYAGVLGSIKREHDLRRQSARMDGGDDYLDSLADIPEGWEELFGLYTGIEWFDPIEAVVRSQNAEV